MIFGFNIQYFIPIYYSHEQEQVFCLQRQLRKVVAVGGGGGGGSKKLAFNILKPNTDFLWGSYTRPFPLCSESENA